MKVALVIVNYNSGELLEQCLSAVYRQTRLPDRVIVVDNASTDDSLSRAHARWEQVKVLRMTQNIGFAAANNRALERCQGYDWVALLNPDAFPEPGWLAALLEAAVELPGAGSFASCLVKADDPTILDGIGDAYHVSGLVWRVGHGEAGTNDRTRREVFAACAAAALYRYESVYAAGGFDENYFCYNEDVDLGFRLRLRGRSCWYVPNAVVRHVGSAVAGAHSDFSLFYGHRNLVWTFFKNMPTPLLWRFLWQHLLLNIITVVILSVRYRSRALIRAKGSAVKGFARVMRQRRKIQSMRSCTNNELLAVMTRGWWRCCFRCRSGG